MITSYLIVFGALSRMVKVRGAYNKPFWIYERLNNCAALAPASYDVLVVASLACPAHKTLPPLPLKRHHWPARGRRNYTIAYISKTTYRMDLGPSPFDSTPRTLRDMKLSFLGELAVLKRMSNI